MTHLSLQAKPYKEKPPPRRDAAAHVAVLPPPTSPRARRPEPANELWIAGAQARLKKIRFDFYFYFFV